MFVGNIVPHDSGSKCKRHGHFTRYTASAVLHPGKPAWPVNSLQVFPIRFGNIHPDQGCLSVMGLDIHFFPSAFPYLSIMG